MTRMNLNERGLSTPDVVLVSVHFWIPCGLIRAPAFGSAANACVYDTRDFGALPCADTRGDKGSVALPAETSVLE